MCASCTDPNTSSAKFECALITLSYGHSISRVRFSYAKLNKQLEGSEQFIKDSLESTPPTVWELKTGAVNFHLESSPIQRLGMEFDLIKT